VESSAPNTELAAKTTTLINCLMSYLKIRAQPQLGDVVLESFSYVVLQKVCVLVILAVKIYFRALLLSIT
jgi:hypothetical protein